jgi:hypothetical protein
MSSMKDFVGKNLFIRTVTHYYTGSLEKVTDDGFLVLTEAAWIPVTGRFGTMMAHGNDNINEVEPYPATLPVWVNMASIVDCNEWKFPLPRDQKPS